KMGSLRPFVLDDLFRFNNVNVDPLTETYGFNFYLSYLINWPEYFQIVEHPAGPIMGYIMGKSEGRNDQWHGHVTALSIAPEFRRIGLAGRLMEGLEQISEEKKAFFVDLFVRVGNEVAVALYESLGYVVYREIINYYGGANEENAYDMRKALSMDVDRKSVIPLSRPVECDDL
ncbi:hypothetical protein PENTCL1PPCAC_59, partial [Pristionchus entomophagus]